MTWVAVGTSAATVAVASQTPTPAAGGQGGSSMASTTHQLSSSANMGDNKVTFGNNGPDNKMLSIALIAVAAIGLLLYLKKK